MADFLLELRCEEIPARMQAGARADLEKLFRAQMGEAGVAVGEVTVWSTPRRLALIARGLPAETEAVREEAKGPPEGAPDAAIDGFCRKSGVTRDQLEIRDVKGRPTYFAVIDRPGRAVKDVLAEAIPAIIRDFPWPKSMRWGVASIGTESLRWVRPLSGILALFDGEVVDCEVDGVKSGRLTKGHRFHGAKPEHDVTGTGFSPADVPHHPADISVDGADDYAEKLRHAHVIVDQGERERIIREGAARVAEEAGLTLVEDEGLVVENAGLTEWPVPLLGRFDEAFLDVPPEVIQLSARTHQKYFICRDKQGELANAFICTANIVPLDGGAAIVDGNRKVLAARLSDARFFWELDQKTPLEEHAKKLERITFHEKLGSVLYRADRTSGFAIYAMRQGWLPRCPEDQVEDVARLAKADLVTEMVGEFPELQGLMGSYYAEVEGYSAEVVEAIRDQYKPLGPADDVPKGDLAVTLSLSEKLQTLCGFFGVGIFPTGSRDPFALRRLALGAIRTITENGLRIPLRQAIQVEMLAIFFARVRVFAESEELEADQAIKHVREFISDPIAAKEAIRDKRFDDLIETILPEFDEARQAGEKLLDFFADRLKVQQREAGVRHDLIDAVFALGGEDDLVRLLARVKALQNFIGTEDGANLLAGYKRAANILKKEEWEAGATNPSPEPAEQALIGALDAAEPKADAAIEAEDFEAAMSALASLRAPIDRFFDEVTVNDDDATKRAARLDLLARFRAAVHKVAEFGRIEG